MTDTNELREKLADMGFDEDSWPDGTLGGNMQPEYFDALLEFVESYARQFALSLLEEAERESAIYPDLGIGALSMVYAVPVSVITKLKERVK